MKIFFLLFAIIAALFVGGCAGNGDVQAPSATIADGIPVYRLAPDDKLKIAVYGEEQLTGEFLVGSDGNISFPLVGMVRVAGLTLAELQAGLASELGGTYLNNPRVSVDMVEYRPVYVLGEVNKAGQFPYKVGMTVNAAVATAGGFTYRANQKVVAIQHYNEAGEKRYRLTSDILVRPGDTIRILERFF
ncbi:MAG: polysaccharide biosynthesis/export family protein [Sphingorhabdus sp.]